MAIFGVGSDIVEISRIDVLYSKKGEKFARRILINGEWDHYKKSKNPVRFLATHFSVKEAASKAFGTGIRNGLAFLQFELLKDSFGKPIMKLHERAAELSIQLGIKNIHVTLTNERHYTYAMVIFEC
ncbi:holo-ACP synthase [Candidatus Schneideria nysicola]|uniref:holo-ACP synthase n=1 Tax=Candidatus Schneideria nysicola TaxID=1081631 RepID=UPI001CAA4E4E|nr:holo-ACP synthase [Candidatus Schneideria nysicola]UAJ65059.1 holo-ACP synthase [Candidatus Schneideria nysicola]UAJ65592.1 holo-ACP synthase [Candidatus Schneideria nysicola]UAJ66119.1 holo-ACP synthase [Candidatus Schneideria nysicola]